MDKLHQEPDAFQFNYCGAQVKHRYVSLDRNEAPSLFFVVKIEETRLFEHKRNYCQSDKAPMRRIYSDDMEMSVIID